MTVFGAVMFKFCWGLVPWSAPLKPANEYPSLAVAFRTTAGPRVYQPLEGLMIPPDTGLTEVVRKYCLLKLAVNVAATAPATTVCVDAPPSDQLANMYCVSVVP